MAGEVIGVVQEEFDKSLVLDPELIEAADSRKLAEMLIARLQHKCSDLRDAGKVYLPDDAAGVVMLVPSIHLDRILKTGFKNQHQTNGTGGVMDRTARWSTEARFAFMALPYTAKTRTLMPKYALQVFHGQGLGNYNVPFNYGQIMVRFKPEVKKRTTWHPGDSLGANGPLRSQALRPAAGTKCEGFCEAQIRGELDASDVQSILVPKGVREEIQRKAEEFGVPIYNYTVEDSRRGTPSGIFRDTEISQVRVEDAPLFQPAPGAAPPKKVPAEPPLATEVLLQKVKAVNFASFGGAGEQLRDEPNSFVAELAARKKTPEIIAALKDVLAKARHRSIRTSALSGLYGLPWNELKPLILPILRAAPKYQPPAGASDPAKRDLRGTFDPLLNMARMMAAEHLDDTEAARALQDVAGPEFVKRIKAGAVCVEERFTESK